MRCRCCGDWVANDNEIAEQLDSARRLAATRCYSEPDLAALIIERADARAVLQRAGLCPWHAYEMQGEAFGGEQQQGAN